MTDDASQKRVQPKELTTWKNAPTVENLKQDLLDSSSEHDAHVSNVDGWHDTIYVQGSAKPKKIEGRSSVQPKVARKQAEWRYAALSEPFLSTEDVFNISPTTHADVEAAKQHELILNYQFNNKLNKVKFINDYVKVAVNDGTVITKAFWVYEEEVIEVERPVFEYFTTDSPITLNTHINLQNALLSDPGAVNNLPEELQEAHRLTMETQQPHWYRQVGTETVEETVVVKNHPSAKVCNYKNVIVDPTAEGDMDAASFVIERFTSSLSQLKLDGKYENLDAVDVEGNSAVAHPDYKQGDETNNFTFSDRPRKKIVVHEYSGYWDIDGDGMVEPIIAAWVGNVMIRLEKSPFPDRKLPYTIAHYSPVVHNNFGEPDAELLVDNQKIIGAVTRGMIDSMARSANGQVGTARGALDIANRRKFDAGENYEFNPGSDPRLSIYMHQFPEMPASAPLMLDNQYSDAESLTGVKAFSSGISGSALGANVGGIRSALDATSKRELDILRRLAEGIKQLGRKFIAMNAEFLSEEEVIRITDDEFVPIKRDDLAGEYDVKLGISTAEADNQKAEELAFMLQTTGPGSDPAEVRMIRAEIARLRKMPALAKRIEEYQPQPDPIAQEKAQLENELLRAKIANETAQAQENMAEAVLDQAKALVEQAKVGNIQSNTDLNNLNYIEQESGVTQEREKEKQQAQAQANIQLKAVESGLRQAESPNNNNQ